MPQPALEQADALASVVVVDRRRWFSAVEEVPGLPVLRDAAVRRRRVRLTYRSAGQAAPSVRTVDPYGVVENAGRWYLVAAHRGRPRSYRVSRIGDIAVLDQPAKVPPNLDLVDLWGRMRSEFERGGAAPTVMRVAVAPAVVGAFRGVATGQSPPDHPPVTTGASHGHGWPVLEVTVRARRAAVALVLGFGGQVVVLAPDDVRHDVVTSAQSALAAHTMVS